MLNINRVYVTEDGNIFHSKREANKYWRNKIKAETVKPIKAIKKKEKPVKRVIDPYKKMIREALKNKEKRYYAKLPYKSQKRLQSFNDLTMKREDLSNAIGHGSDQYRLHLDSININIFEKIDHIW